jgi:hypothetical protein
LFLIEFKKLKYTQFFLFPFPFLSLFRALHLILFKCEWFWAEINQLRNELSNNSRKKHHLRSVCLNSLKFIKDLKSLSQETIDIRSNLRLEYLGYANFLEGIVKNELKEFSASFICLQKSKIILEELIERKFQVSLLETKISELETVMRVCKYSADMYDVLIEVNEDELDEFKINQLTEKFLESKIDDKIKEKSIAFYSKSVKLASEIKPIYSDKKNLKIALKIFKKQVKGTSEYENARIRLSYFEDLFYCKLIKKCFKNICKEGKGPKLFNCSNVLKKLAKSHVIFNIDEDSSKQFDILTRLLWNLSNIFGNNDRLDVSKNASEALELIKIKNIGKFPRLREFTEVVLRAKKYLIPHLNALVIKNAIYNFKGSAPVPPKPSFYDIAFDYINYEPDVMMNQESIMQSSASTSASASGFSNLLSGFWGKK